SPQTAVSYNSQSVILERLLSVKAGANIQRFFLPNQNFFRKIFDFKLKRSTTKPLPATQPLPNEHHFVPKAGANVR
ncbi:hypothetical protein, partial [Gramella sp. KN1008]|uniref:hypothetical protein n=1 Tax=Gramella sp. KN1008 TaxID=2529298 RepID=UPI001A953B40